MVPFFGNIPKIFAGDVDVNSTNRFIEMRPVRTPPSYTRLIRVSTPGAPLVVAVPAIATEGRAPIDHFFRTLSESYDGDSVGVILSVVWVLIVTAAGAAVIEIGENLKALFENLVRFTTLDVDNETDAARVVFEPRVIEPLFHWTAVL